MPDPELAYAGFEDGIRERIWVHQLTIDHARACIDTLAKQLSHPRVLVTLHYKHYFADRTSDIAEGCTLEEAYHQLWHLTYDNGIGSPTGIEVGGLLIKWHELVEEFGEYQPW